MVSSLLKIISSGIQEKRIYTEKTIFPFLKTWSRRGRFATRWERLDFANPPDFGVTSKLFIKNKGELLSRICLVATLPDIFSSQDKAMKAVGASYDFIGPRFGWINSIGHGLIKNVSIYIGGSLIDTIDFRLLEVLDEFSTPLEKVSIVNRLIKRVHTGFLETSFGNTPEPTKVIIPLPFWFSRGDFTSLLPIDALRNDEIVLKMEFHPFHSLYYTDSRNFSSKFFDSSGTYIKDHGLAVVSEFSGSALWPIENSRFYQQTKTHRDASGNDDTIYEGSIVPGIYDGGYELPMVPIAGVTMPSVYHMGETYLMAEYVYLDNPEAQWFRSNDLQIPILQHYIFPPVETEERTGISIPLSVKNPVRHLYWFGQRVEAPFYNAHFVATRDLTRFNEEGLWWPDALCVNPVLPSAIRSGFALSDSELFSTFALIYEEKFVRFRTKTPSIYRSIIPSFEQKKSPWINRYYYNFSFGHNDTETPLSKPQGEANFGKINNIHIDFEFRPKRGNHNSNEIFNYNIYLFAEAYNIMKIFDGRAALMFNY